MGYYSDATHADLIANPAHIADYYNSGWSQFASDLGVADAGEWMDNPLLAATFASMIANDLKPYGAEGNGLDISTLLNLPTLACSGFVGLAWNFINLIPQCAGLKIRAIGWDNGCESDDPPSPVGNHAQMIAKDATGTLLLDPTIGMVVKADYNDIVRGIPVDMTKSTTFCTKYQSDPIKAPFSAEVNSALANGSFRPCHALYFWSQFDLFANAPPEATWPTPSGARFQV
jgi:hypothetical protein